VWLTPPRGYPPPPPRRKRTTRNFFDNFNAEIVHAIFSLFSPQETCQNREEYSQMITIQVFLLVKETDATVALLMLSAEQYESQERTIERQVFFKFRRCVSDTRGMSKPRGLVFFDNRVSFQFSRGERYFLS
jgi:hypothetical protein